MQIVQRGFGVIVITAVTNGIDVCNADRGVVIFNRACAPRIVVIPRDGCSVGIVNTEDIALCVLAKVVCSLRIACTVGKAKDATGCIVQIQDK